MKLHVDAALLRLLGYCFYVLKCEPGDSDFAPRTERYESYSKVIKTCVSIMLQSVVLSIDDKKFINIHIRIHTYILAHYSTSSDILCIT